MIHGHITGERWGRFAIDLRIILIGLRKQMRERALVQLRRAEFIRRRSTRRLRAKMSAADQYAGMGRTLATRFSRRREEKEIAKAGNQLGSIVKGQRELVRRIDGMARDLHNAVRAAVTRAMEQNEKNKQAARQRRRHGPKL